MANTLSKVGITTGNTVQDYHVTQSIDAFTATEAYDISLSGSFNMTGSINGEPGIINPLTASYAITASYTQTASYVENAQTASFVTASNVYGPYGSNSVISASYAVTASYVEGSIDNLGVSPLTVRVATTAGLPNSPVYDNGPLNDGVGAFLSGSSNGALPNINGEVILVNDRILIKNETPNLRNGVYEVTQKGGPFNPYILTRTTDSDQTSEFDPQVVIPSEGGQAGLLFAQTTNNPIIGTSNIVYSQISTNTYVTQTTSGTQISSQIPWWTSTNRQLSKGTNDLTFNSTTGLLFCNTGSANKLLIGTSSLYSGTDLRVLIKNGSAGVSSVVSGTTVAIENSTTNYLTLLSPNAQGSGIVMGSPGDGFASRIFWGYTLNYLELGTFRSNSEIRFRVGDKYSSSLQLKPINTQTDPEAYLVLTGSLVIAPTNPLPTVINGGIAFSSSGDFYFGSGSAWNKLNL